MSEVVLCSVNLYRMPLVPGRWGIELQAFTKGKEERKLLIPQIGTNTPRCGSSFGGGNNR
jgi:hypothetical protein